MKLSAKMNKHTVIVVIASVVIASAFGYSGWNIYAADQLQIKWTEEGRFSYFEMINDDDIEICNPLPFFVNFNRFDIVTFFDKEPQGTYSAFGTTIPPSSSSVVNGTFKSEVIVEAQYFFLHFDSMFSGTAPVRIDPTKFFVVTEIQTPIIGLIPYSVTKQYSGMDFWNIMNGKDGDFNC